MKEFKNIEEIRNYVKENKNLPERFIFDDETFNLSQQANEFLIYLEEDNTFSFTVNTINGDVTPQTLI